MRRFARTVVLTVGLPLAIAMVVGCSNLATPDSSTDNGRMRGRGGTDNNPGEPGNNSGGSGNNSGGGMMGRGGSGEGSFASDGERIYLTGVGADGQRISRSATRVSQGSLMMGGGGCGSCHGPEGRGGTIRVMSGTTIKTPDITYDALIKEGFKDATIRAAIRDGVDETGKPLEDAMPRWRMSDADLSATIAYLKELSAR